LTAPAGIGDGGGVEYAAANAPQPASPCRDWAAVHDREPPGPGRLRVTGRCTVPTPAHTVELRRAEPQGSNPADILLDRIVQRSPGITTQVETEVAVEYTEETDQRIDTVTVRPDGVTIRVQRVL
jgi:hypothetical protein